MSSVMWDGMTVNGFECVCAFDMGFWQVGWVSTHPLAEVAQFVGAQGVPDGFVFWVLMQWVVFE